MRFFLLAFLLFPGLSLGADPDQPHEHRGLISAYQGAPPDVSLTRPDLIALRKGEAVLKQHNDGEAGGRGVAVFRVNASRDKVMETILNFPKYVDWVDNLTACEIYRSEGRELDVRMVTRAVAMNVEWFVRHQVDRANYWVTWTLDYDRNSDLDDSVGYWKLKEVPNQPGVTQVEYSVDIRLKGWVPGFVKNMLVNKGLEGATSWVKVQSEGR